MEIPAGLRAIAEFDALEQMLVQDIAYCEALLNMEDSPAFRRQLVRAVFAHIEAAVYRTRAVLDLVFREHIPAVSKEASGILPADGIQRR